MSYALVGSSGCDQGQDASSPSSTAAQESPTQAPSSEQAIALPESARRSGFEVKHGSFWKAFAYTEANPNTVPSGVNDWTCEPNAKHPRPVVLVHGTWVNQYDSFAKMAPRLADEGWCLYTFNFGKGGDKLPLEARFGTAELSKSVLELKTFTQEVLDRTSADKVDMVGWSQGGILIRSYLKDHGGADVNNPEKNRVQNVVTLGSPHHGTTLSGIALLSNLLGITERASDIIGKGPSDQAIGSEFLRKLNDGDDTVPGVTYTSIFTLYDQITNPVTNCLLEAGPGATVHNVNVQKGCPIDFSEHLALPFTDRVIALTAQGLDPDSEYHIPCKFQFGSF